MPDGLGLFFELLTKPIAKGVFMTKAFLVAVIMVSFSVACLAKESGDSYMVNGKESTKTDAIKALMADKSASVVRCQVVELKENKTSIGLKVKRASR